MSNDDFSRRLNAEVSRWETDGLIATEQAAAIRARYEISGSAEGGAIGNRVVSVLAIMGAALIGLGIIAFIAANWSGISTLSRLVLMVVGTPTIYIAGWMLAYRFGYARIGTAVILLGAIAFGASIHLIAQTYHVPVHHPNLVGVWFLGVLPLAYVTRSRSVAGLMLILFVAGAGFRAQEWFTELDESALFLMPPAYLALAAGLFGLGRLHSRYEYTRPLARMFESAGLLVAGVSLYVLSFHILWENVGQPADVSLRVEYWVVMAAAGIIAAGTTLGGVFRDHGRGRELLCWELSFVIAAAGTVGATLAGLAFALEWMWWVFNLVMLGGVIGMIAAGYRLLRADLINFAVAVFAITVFTRYFEFGFGLLGQSLAFIVTGVLLLVVGFGLEFLRRRMVQRIRSQDVAQ